MVFLKDHQKINLYRLMGSIVTDNPFDCAVKQLMGHFKSEDKY